MSYMLLPPICRTKHNAFTLTQAEIGHYADAHMEVLMKTRTISIGREELRVCWTNQTQ